MRRLGVAMLSALMAVLLVRACAAAIDIPMGIRYPYQFDYGEGIVWQQALLMLGPRQYSASPDLPFVVFHYPPLYHLAVRLMANVMPDMLSAGRTVSGIATVSIIPLVALITLASFRGGLEPLSRRDVAIAVSVGLLAFCLQAVKIWGFYMRVDTLAVALSLAGVLAAVSGDGGFRSTSLGLMLCLASVYTKQTELPAGVAIFVVALFRNPRKAIAAGVFVGALGLAALGGLQHATGGGFLRNIILYNVNRLDVLHGYYVLREGVAGNKAALLMPLAAFALVAESIRGDGSASRSIDLLQTWRHALKNASSKVVARSVVLAYFCLATVLLMTVFKSGSYYNYLIEWLCVGCVIIGMFMGSLKNDSWQFPLVTLFLVLTVSDQPLRAMGGQIVPERLQSQAALVTRIAAADRPVASADMVLLMRAGKPVVYEPAIVTELAALGAWDETPLVEMTRAGGFAFILTADDVAGGSVHRSPAVDAAMRMAYPRVERVGPALWIHLPRE